MIDFGRSVGHKPEGVNRAQLILDDLLKILRIGTTPTTFASESAETGSIGLAPAGCPFILGCRYLH
jgi:hypothetical protein